MKQNFKNWIDANGDKTHRLDYSLDGNSIVFDVGGYKGNFATDIDKKFGCNIFIFEPVSKFVTELLMRFNHRKKIVIYPFALDGNEPNQLININNDSSSLYTNEQEVKQEVYELISSMLFNKVIELTKVRFIDLCKINIEGSEYSLLDNMIETGLLNVCDNIQVQFHTFIPDFEQKYEKIKIELEKTHDLTWKYPFIWENWRLKPKYKSYSQVGQDKWVLNQFSSCFKGDFLDIGCQLPRSINNTLLLEESGWNGISIDIVNYSNQWKNRKTRFIQADILKMDLSVLQKRYNYLSLDTHGNYTEILTSLFDYGFEFQYITVEHDSYRLGDSEKFSERKLLKKHGYKLINSDVKLNNQPFEDWWFNPNYEKI